VGTTYWRDPMVSSQKSPLQIESVAPAPDPRRRRRSASPLATTGPAPPRRCSSPPGVAAPRHQSPPAGPPRPWHGTLMSGDAEKSSTAGPLASHFLRSPAPPRLRLQATNCRATRSRGHRPGRARDWRPPRGACSPMLFAAQRPPRPARGLAHWLLLLLGDLLDLSGCSKPAPPRLLLLSPPHQGSPCCCAIEVRID
jgi:hypothetical protein